MRRHQAASALALVATLALTVSMAGPQVGASSGKPVVVRMWNGATGPGATALTSMVNEFNHTHKHVFIKNRFITQSDQLLAKLSTALKVNAEPTILLGDTPTNGPELLKSGKLLHLNGTIPTVDKEVFPAYVKATTYRGVQFAVPYEGGDYALYYNKTEFKAAGIKHPPTTWAQVIRDSKKLTNPAKNRFGIYVPFGHSEWTVYTWEGMLWAEGGHFLNKSKTAVAFDSPQGIAALTLWRNLLYKYHVAPLTSFATPSNSDGEQAFASGLVAMLIDGPWDLTTFKSAHIDYGVTLFPAVKQYATNTGEGIIDVFNTSKPQVHGALQFIDWLMAPAHLAQWFSMIPGSMPIEAAVLNDPVYVKSEAPYASVFNANQKYAHTRPTLVSYPQISAILGKEIDLVLHNDATPAKALATAAKQADAILKANHE